MSDPFAVHERPRLLRNTVIVANTICLVAVLTQIYYFYQWRRHRLLQVTTPPLMLCIGAGATLTLTYVYALAAEPSIIGCGMRAFALQTGYFIGFSALALKIYRVHLLLKGTNKPITDAFLLRVVVAIGILSLFFCLMWTLIDPLYPQWEEQEDYMIKFRTCGRTPPLWNTPLILCEFVGTFVLASLGYRLRHAPLPMNESVQIALAAYNLAFTAVITFPLVIFFVDHPDGLFFLKAMSVMVSATSFVTILFLPPLLAHRDERKKGQGYGTGLNVRRRSSLEMAHNNDNGGVLNTQFGAHTHPNDAGSFRIRGLKSTCELLKKENEALKQKLERREIELMMMRRERMDLQSETLSGVEVEMDALQTSSYPPNASPYSSRETLYVSHSPSTSYQGSPLVDRGGERLHRGSSQMERDAYNPVVSFSHIVPPTVTTDHDTPRAEATPPQIDIHMSNADPRHPVTSPPEFREESPSS